MAFDFDKLKKTVSDAANSAAKTAQDKVPDSVKNSNTANTLQGWKQKADDAVKSIQEQLPESMKDVDVKASLKDMAEKGSEAVAKFTKQSAATDKAADKALAEQNEEYLIAYEDAMKVIYCLIAVDRVVSEKETEKYIDIGTQIDPLFAEYKDRIIEECQTEFNKAADDEDYYDVVHDYAAHVIRNTQVQDDKAINAKSLYWNLLATGYVDDDYSNNEQRLIKYVARLLNIDAAVTLEMEAALKALLAIEEEKLYLQESGRPYKEVQVHMEDMEARKQAIMQGVFALVSD